MRPEDFAIEVDPDGKGFVTHRSFLGATTRLVVQVGEIPVRVDVRSETAADIELGQPRQRAGNLPGRAGRAHVGNEMSAAN